MLLFVPGLPCRKSIRCVDCRLAGVGGNLVAVHASRISTSLHQKGLPGSRIKDDTLRGCLNPVKVFFGGGEIVLRSNQSTPQSKNGFYPWSEEQYKLIKDFLLSKRKKKVSNFFCVEKPLLKPINVCYSQSFVLNLLCIFFPNETFSSEASFCCD